MSSWRKRMPLRAIDKLGNNYMSYKFPIEKRQDILCPNCDSNFIFVDAELKIKHFRHEAYEGCESEPETEEHLNYKKRMFDILKKDKINTDVQLEYKIGNQIADVYCKHGNLIYVIECQCSIISLEEVKRRTQGWKEKNVYLLWIWGVKYFGLDTKTNYFNVSSVIRNKYSFYTMNPLTVIEKVNISSADRWIEETDFGGGYYKYYKTKRELEFEEIYNPKIVPYYSMKRKNKLLLIMDKKDDT
tara:strand:+ start:1239 stop:1970 length:732 start_codon:yes stop_codon:yes gene_type:complete